MTRCSGATKICCPSCGGNLVESEIIFRGKGAEKTQSVGRCLGCGAEYDRRTKEYYKLFQDFYQLGALETVFSLGLKGELGEQGCELNGRLRLQPEELDKPAVTDEWQVVTGDGSYLWIAVERGSYFFCTLYEPVSFNMDADDRRFEFEGRLIDKRCARRYRVVSTDGYLRYSMGVGDAVTVYRFRVNGTVFEVLVLPDKKIFRKCERISPAEALYLFRRDDYGDILDKHFDTVKKRKFRCLWYLAMALCCLLYVLWVTVRQKQVLSSSKPAVVLSGGAKYLSEGAYGNQLLYGPVTMDGSGTLCRLSVENSRRDFTPCNNWISLRLMLIRREKLGQLPNPSNIFQLAKMRETFNEIDAMKQPLEDFSHRDYFWQVDGKNHKGSFRLLKNTAGTAFVLEEKGAYYVYLESYGTSALPPESLRISITEKAGDTGYPAAAGFLFFVLALFNYKRFITAEGGPSLTVPLPEADG